MGDFWLEIGITAVLTALRDAVKNPEKKAKLRPAMLKIGATILAVWYGDPQFDEALYAKASYEKSKLG